MSLYHELVNVPMSGALTFVEDGLPLDFEPPPSCALTVKERPVPKRAHESIRIRAVMLRYQSPPRQDDAMAQAAAHGL